MKTIYFKFFLVTVFLLSFRVGVSQCTNFGTQWPTTTQSTTSPSLVSISTCMFGGDYTECNVVLGTTYTWSTCSSTGFDTQLSLYNTIHTVSYAYNDDACGLQSVITWTATFTGLVHVLLSEYNCISNGECQGLDWSASPPAAPITITACTGSFTDSGGPTASYSDNENEVYIICPSTPGMVVQLNFSQFELEDNLLGGCYDYLEVYNTFLKNKEKPIMTIYKNNNNLDKSNVIYENNSLIEYNKSLKKPEMEYIDYGLSILNSDIFNNYNEGINFDLSEVMHDLSIKNQLIGHIIDKRFYEIGSYDGIHDTELFLEKF